MIQSIAHDVEGINLHAYTAGTPGEQPPVLLLHGWPTNGQLWRHALPAIGAHRYAVALDLPGFGASGKPLDASYSFRFFDRMLTGFLDAAGIDRVGLVVHDLGGPVGLHWAMGNRDRVTDLVVLNTLVFPELSWAVKAFVGASYLPGVRELMSSPWGIDQAMRLGVTNRARLTDDVLELYRAPYVDKASRRALLRAAHGLHPGGLQTIARGLAEVDVPTTLIFGEADRILPDVAQTMARLQSLVPHATCTSIPDCGHFLQEDRPELVTEHLVQSLTSL
ncbi:MAG: alpha/beta fold hydrolase [Myxococcota bacterium]